MQKDIVINVSEYETRLAILEDLKLVELLMERPEAERMVGDIYKGAVKDVLPGMQAAFVDIGIGKNAFLHVSDVGLVEESGTSRKERKIEDVIKQG
ncbi:MAG TPA: S1 RNA-binding domain-containing protein, partial [candidate division Zixibacteria bacterium]